MTRAFMLTGAAALILGAGAATLAAPAQDRPGIITQARVFVENRNRAEAVPISIEGSSLDRPLPVHVDGVVNVSLASPAVVTMRQAQQPWEYQTIDGRSLQDMGGAMRTAGSQGWEAIAVQSGDSGFSVLMKRPASPR